MLHGTVRSLLLVPVCYFVVPLLLRVAQPGVRPQCFGAPGRSTIATKPHIANALTWETFDAKQAARTPSYTIHAVVQCKSAQPMLALAIRCLVSSTIARRPLPNGAHLHQHGSGGPEPCLHVQLLVHEARRRR